MRTRDYRDARFLEPLDAFPAKSATSVHSESSKTEDQRAVSKQEQIHNARISGT